MINETMIEREIDVTVMCNNSMTNRLRKEVHGKEIVTCNKVHY